MSNIYYLLFIIYYLLFIIYYLLFYLFYCQSLDIQGLKTIITKPTPQLCGARLIDVKPSCVFFACVSMLIFQQLNKPDPKRFGPAPNQIRNNPDLVLLMRIFIRQNAIAASTTGANIV
jgi:hypothetical protein